MKRIYLMCLVMFWSIPASAQSLYKYYIMPYEVSIMELEPAIESVITFKNKAFNELFKGVIIRDLAVAFPQIKNEYLRKTHIVTVENESDLVEKLQDCPWLEYVEPIEEPQLAMTYPNDYALPYSNTNHYLDLVRAPFAWSITKGDPNILVGVADSYFTFKHEELKNKIVKDLNLGGTHNNFTHGTEVASIIGGETENQLGTASLGYHTKMVVYSAGLHSTAVERLSREAGVRVINMSWLGRGSSLTEASLFSHIRDSLNIVLVGSAGNGTIGNNCGGINNNGYCYPASYESVISVTGVGSRYFRATDDVHFGRYNWEDVSELYVGNNEVTLTVNDKVNISAPAYDIYRATNTLGLEGSVDTYGEMGYGTSSAAPLVSAAAALVLAVNPSLTAKQVEEILLETADNIYDIPENAAYKGLLGTGRLNAYRAVLTAKCMVEPSSQLDLMIQDRRDDFGVEPNTTTVNFWESPGIWVRNQRDGKNIRVTENPEHDANGYSYVYVKVINKSCVTSSGNDKLRLYWSKAASYSSWPQNWNGSYYFQGALMGNHLGVLNIPVLQPGEDVILEFPWQVPNPALYPNVDENGDNLPWHFCLLARIDSTADPMTYAEGSDIIYNAQYNNNIAWKNVSVVNLLPDSPPGSFKTTIAIGTHFSDFKEIQLAFEANNSAANLELFKEVEVVFTMDEILYNAWNTSHRQNENIKRIGERNFLITEPQTTLDHLVFDSVETALLTLTFNFKDEVIIPENSPFVFRVIQRDQESNKILGGETFEVRKPFPYNRELEFPNSERVTENNVLLAIAPNPTSSNVTIGYSVTSCENAYLSIVPFYGVSGTTQNLTLDAKQNQIETNVSTYPSGLYKVLLHCNGKVVDSKSLLIEKK